MTIYIFIFLLKDSLLLLFFFFFMAATMAHGGSQDRGQIRAVAAGLQ